MREDKRIGRIKLNSDHPKYFMGKAVKKSRMGRKAKTQVSQREIL